MHMLFYEKFTLLKMGGKTPWEMILLGILTYSSLFSPIYIFDFEAFALT